MGFKHSRLNAVIAESGMSKTAISEQMGVHLNTISNWTRGHATPSFDSLVKLLQVIGWTEDQIADRYFGDWYTLNGHTSGAE